MSTIAEKLTAIAEAKADIKAAIIDKGQEVGDDLTTYAEAIANISGDETISSTPHVGDVAILLNGEKKFLTSLATTEQCTNATKIGVVYDVEEQDDGTTLVRVVGDGNTTSKQWSSVCDYEITAIPSASGDYEVKLNNVSQGNFTYTRSEGTIEEFCTQLDVWLKAQGSTTKAAKWESYYDSEKGKGYLQMFKYDEYESTVTIASTSLTKLVGSEIASYTNSAIYNTIGKNATYSGMCRERLEAYCKTNTSANCNPTTAVDGTTKLFVTFPCSETYFNGDLGVNLRARYSTYQEYMDACMVNLENTSGITKYHSGKEMTQLLSAKTVKKDGTAVRPYDAAMYAMEYTKGVDGFGAGAWWLPSMYELGKLMRPITSAQTDVINTALGKCGYAKIATTSYRWSCCRCNTYSAWNYNYNGFSGNNYFYYSFTCSVVSAFEI